MSIQLQQMNDEIASIENFLSNTKFARKQKDDLVTRITSMREELQYAQAELDKYMRASALVGRVSDSNVKKTLGLITGLINRALAIIFPEDKREIDIIPSLYRNAYPHFTVKLYTGDDKKQVSFNQSGSGLAQIVSFLCILSLIDARSGRPLIVLDECLNGLHPLAKDLMTSMIKAVSNRYQFIIVEYGYDIGKQYEVMKKGKVSTIDTYKDNMYYTDLSRKQVEKMQSAEKTR